MLILAAAIGVLVGIVVGVLGAGGGMLSVPVLVYLLGQSAHAATAESLVIVGLSSLVSLLSPGRARYIHVRDGLLVSGLAIAGSIAGARLNPLVPSPLLLTMFSVLLVSVGIVMLRKGLIALRKAQNQDLQISREPAQKEGQFENVGDNEGQNTGAHRGERSMPILIVTATLMGVLTGFFGVGGGFIVVPMFVLVVKLQMREAVVTSLLIMVVMSISGLVARVNTGIEIEWGIVLVFAAGSMLGGFLGGPVSAKIRQEILTLLFALLLLTVGGVMGVNTAVTVFS